MQSQHGVPSSLTAAPMYGQYGDGSADSYRTGSSYPVPNTPPPPTLPSPSSCPHCLSEQRSVKCQNCWRHDTLKMCAPDTSSQPPSQVSNHWGHCRYEGVQASFALHLCVSPFMLLCVCVRVSMQNGRPWCNSHVNPNVTERKAKTAAVFSDSHTKTKTNIHTKPTKRSHSSQVWLIQVWTMRSDMQENHSVVPLTQMQSAFFLIFSPVCLRTSLVPVLSDSCWLLLSTPLMLVCEAKIELLSLFVQGRSHRREDEQQAGKHGGDVRWRRL